MTLAARSDVASSFTILKGALIEESYSFLASWDPSQPKDENLRRWKDQNPVGLRTETWLRDVAFVMSRRFDPEGRDRALQVLAKGRCDLEEWKPILLWHITRDEFVLRDFLQNWLFGAFEDGLFQVRAEDLYNHLQSLQSRGGLLQKAWSASTVDRVAHALLVMVKDFGLLRGGATKEFASYHLPERSFLYLLHAMRDERISPGKVVGASDWRMFLMRPSDVDLELLRLHQFHKIEYHVAGSLVQLSLPCTSSRGYAERMTA
jgi:hypothetical protein